MFHCSSNSYHIQRPRVCPFAARNRRFTDSDVLSSSRKWIPVACSCLLHISGLDGLFLTRRPWHMRSYPGVWVPPGGHCESGEPIQDTAFRELTEELGLHSLSENGRDIGSECSIEPLCAWEAAYPSRSDTVVGKQAVIPNSHHMVIYYSINWSSLSRPVSSLNDIHLHLPRFNLEVDEVSAVVWLPRSVLVKLSSDWEAFEKYFQNQSTTSASGYTYPELSTMPSTVQIDVDQTPVWYWSINSTEWQWIPVNQLICGLTSNRNPSINPELITQSEMKRQPSAVTLGTLYAISRWLASTTTG
ncbi:unnamed protein product [Heterobilharzia americana]|nr:unnamed protein product [Heterobilharzia americana]